MILLFEYSTVERDEINNLPTDKVIRSEMFGGLHVVSAACFDFVLKLACVFVRCLTWTKLAVLRNKLVQ